MEEPISFNADDLRAEKETVLATSVNWPRKASPSSPRCCFRTQDHGLGQRGRTRRRPALVWNESTARLARQHNDVNVIAIDAYAPHQKPKGETFYRQDAVC
jgi:hypothetical protein